MTKEDQWEEAGDKALRQAEQARQEFREHTSLLLRDYKHRVEQPKRQRP